MINYATAQATATDTSGRLQVMNITHPFDFPSASIDLIHKRLIRSSLKEEDWRVLLTECLRLRRPVSAPTQSRADLSAF